VLLLYGGYGREAVKGAVERALEIGISDGAFVKVLAEMCSKPEPSFGDLPESLLP
jgi:hypothetical protein